MILSLFSLLLIRDPWEIQPSFYRLSPLLGSGGPKARYAADPLAALQGVGEETETIIGPLGECGRVALCGHKFRWGEIEIQTSTRGGGMRGGVLCDPP